MKKLNLAVFAILLFIAQASVVFAQENKVETTKRKEQTDKLIKPIEAYVKTIEDFVDKEKKPHIVIADISDYNKADQPIWRKYDSEEEFEKAREVTESYNIAYIWKKNGKVVQVNFTYSSPSGDWVEYYFQTYRPDGTLAKVEREMRTFLGDIIITRTQIYNEKGKLLKEAKNYRDLNTGKPVKATDNYQSVDAGEVYKKTSDLPFVKLLAGKK
jgi:hypothetical protein